MPHVPIDALRCRVTWREHAYKILSLDSTLFSAPPEVRRDLSCRCRPARTAPLIGTPSTALGLLALADPQRHGFKYNNNPAAEALRKARS